MTKHIPVLLNEVLTELKSLNKDELIVLDCTLGQAGHSIEIFKSIKRGVLISIDLDRKSIEWVADYFSDELQVTSYEVAGMEVFALKSKEPSFAKASKGKQAAESREQKIWNILQGDFAEIDKIAEIFQIKKFDFILADLGFSNLQLHENLGISFSSPRQRLDMRYDDYQRTESKEQRAVENSKSEILNSKNHPFYSPPCKGWEGPQGGMVKHETRNSKLVTPNLLTREHVNNISASDILNTFSAPELEKILIELGQIEHPKGLVADIINKRKFRKFERVEDILSILNKKKYPKNYKVKFFQALRSFVNRENERLTSFLSKMPDLLSDNGKAAIITFNPIEEDLIKNHLKDVRVIEPNINEIIKNPQSRSAKLYIYKKQSVKDQT